ncbi:hypothetical protein CUT44_14335 [Streptomyces carminius]|uniref:Uncharacterized protein n=1 Tax=Streptomyces carminius TaxID=2665496 RepID=A0A2M8LZ03_9ACTN|nr:hypothetical protein [Streptomyces carminius]PJE97154.1 hypothetical protein CUT44_14335 [Streptomyces carminius]
MESWSGEDFDVLYDLLVAANTPSPLARLRLRLRLTLLMWTGAVMPFYALGELLWAAQNKVSKRLNKVMDRLDERCSNAETACRQVGDQALAEHIGLAFDWVSNAVNSVGRKAARLVRG